MNPRAVLRQRPNDRGSITLWFVVIMLVLVCIVGLVVDGGGKIQARQRANFVAEEAARAAGQEIVRPLGMRGIATVVDPLTAQLAAQAYLARAGVPGVVIPVSPTTLVITTTITYQPKFLGLIGIGPQVVTGRATVNLNHTNTPANPGVQPLAP